MEDLKLLQIIPSLESGGAEQGTVDVANYTASKGLGSFIASSGGKMLPEFNRKLVHHINLPLHSKNIFTMFRNIKKLKKVIEKHNINLVHVRSRAPAWILRYISSNQFKTVSTFHNVYGHQNFLKRYYNQGLCKVDKIVAISEYVKSSIIDIYKINKKKITVINRGIDIDFFNPEISNENQYLEFLSKYNLPNDKKIILYPGRLTSWKGQIEFLNIVELLDVNNIICYFIGDDKNVSYANKLINEIKKRNLSFNCKILGHLSKEDVRFMYKSADIIISAPKKPEGFGRIVSESLAMKKIVLSYNFGGAKNQLMGLDKLFSVNPFNQDEMIEKINKVFKFSINTINDLGEISRDHVAKKFSKKMMLEKYYNFYHKNI